MRAHRYPLELPLRYRSLGDQSWSTGTTANISRSGVLFQGEKPLGIDTEIEIGITLPSNGSSADIVGRGRVVRAETAMSDAEARLAVVFSKFRLERAHV